MARINYELWGRGADRLGLTDGYAMGDGIYPDIDCVVRSLERRTRLHCCAGPRSEGTALSKGRPVARHYAITLGEHCPGGGYTPRGEVWIALPITVEEN